MPKSSGSSGSKSRKYFLSPQASVLRDFSTFPGSYFRFRRAARKEKGNGG